MKTVVFIMKRDFFGTRLIHLPFLDGLKKAYTDNELIVFSPFTSGVFYKDIGLAKEAHVFDRGLVSMVRALRQIKPDLIVSLRSESDRLNFAIGLSGARVRVGYGTVASSRLLFTATVPRNYRIYRGLDYANVFSLAGVHVKLDTYFREQAQRATLTLPPGRELFCMIPGGGAGEFKRWGIGNFIRLCERLAGNCRNAAFVFIMGPDEQDEVAQIHAASIGAKSVVLLNESVANCARAVATSRVTVANDCGPVHMAEMMQVPLVVLFSNHDGFVYSRMSEWFYPRKGALPVISESMQDVKTIPVERVAAAVDQVLTPDRTDSEPGHDTACLSGDVV